MCDTLVSLTDEGVLFAKNSDRDPNESQQLRWFEAADHDIGGEMACTWVSIPQVARTNAVLVSQPWWMWGAEMGTNEFGVTIGNEAVFTKQPLGEPALLGAIVPEIPGVTWKNEALTGPAGSGDGIVIHGGERASIMHLRGTVPLGAEIVVKGAVTDPERYAAHHLREALLAAGITVSGEAVGAGDLVMKNEAVPVIGKELLVHQSPPLLEIIRSIHETSDNHETECLFQTLALQTGMPPAEAVRSHWA